MPTNDTIKLLIECNSGTKMAVESLNEVLEKVKDEKLHALLSQSLKEHETLGDLTHQKLIEFNDPDKEPNPIAKAMAWMSTNIKLLTGDVDEKIADMVTDGCNMGIKSIAKHLNQYPNAQDNIKDIANQLIKLEEKLAYSLRAYL